MAKTRDTLFWVVGRGLRRLRHLATWPGPFFWGAIFNTSKALGYDKFDRHILNVFFVIGSIIECIYIYIYICIYIIIYIYIIIIYYYILYIIYIYIVIYILLYIYVKLSRKDDIVYT